jgi:hypothetical protein
MFSGFPSKVEWKGVFLDLCLFRVLLHQFASDFSSIEFDFNSIESESIEFDIESEFI